jgi:tricorn protease
MHIPDMGEEGFCEFFRSYMQEFDKEGLIIDVRFNRGGHISSLLLSVLTRKRLGFDQSRWENKIPYLMESPRGPMVALCNELTASDGDMFAYSFKALQMGPLIGKRTWGGVIGIFPRHPLLDGSMTSQPEYAIWFHDIGWRLENRGAEPDILVENTPQEEVKGLDSQLERGIQEVLKKINAVQ